MEVAYLRGPGVMVGITGILTKPHQVMGALLDIYTTLNQAIPTVGAFLIIHRDTSRVPRHNRENIGLVSTCACVHGDTPRQAV